MKTQSGRSMIEMLGVLAIIGVLSVGGLAGYTRAMRANRVNNALDFVNRCYVEVRARGAGTDAVACGNCGGGFLGAEANPNGVADADCQRVAGGQTRCTVQFATADLADAANQKIGAGIANPTAATLFLYDPTNNAARGGWANAAAAGACGVAP